MSTPDLPPDLDRVADPSTSYTYVDLEGETQGPFEEAALVRWHLDGFMPRSQRAACASTGVETTIGEIVDRLFDRGRGEAKEGETVTEDETRRTSSLDAKLERLLKMGGGSLPMPAVPGFAVGLGDDRVVGSKTENSGAEEDALGITLDASAIALEKYRKPRGWRDILSATREMVRKGRAAMREPMAETDETNTTWSLEVSATVRDPRPDLSKLDEVLDEEGALPEEPAALDLREPFWVIEDRASKDGELDPEALNAAVAEQLRNTAKPLQSADAQSDRSDVSWSVKPGGLDRQQAREAAVREAREAAVTKERESRAKAMATEARRGESERDERMPEISAQEETQKREAEAVRFFAAKPYAGQWWLPDDTRGGEFALGPFTYDDLVSRLPNVMVAHRREDDAWRVVGPYSARERFENYGRDIDGALVSLSRDEGDDAAAERDMEITMWFDVATAIIAGDEDLKDPFPCIRVDDGRDVRAWFDKEMSKVELRGGIAPPKSPVAPQRKRRRGFEMRVVANEQQNLISARVLGELYQAVTKNRKKLFAGIVEPVVDDWLREQGGD